MTKSKLGIKTAKNVPKMKEWGVVRKTDEWKRVVAQVEAGKSIEIRLPDHLNDSIHNPNNAFMAALKRKYRRTYQIYARARVIYAIPKENP